MDGPGNVQKIGKIAKSLRKKLGRIFTRTKSQSSSGCVPLADADSTTEIDRTHEHITSIDILLSHAESTTEIDHIEHITTIDNLPGDVLLQIFVFCQVGPNSSRSLLRPVLEWHRLIHVCRSWRQTILSSPRRLDLYLLCTRGTPVRKNLGHWPAFPIIIDYVRHLHHNSKGLSPKVDDEDNIIAALEHPDRVRSLKLLVTSLLLGKVATVAQEQFPVLTQLWLRSKDENVSVLPKAFLGGSTPLLQEIDLEGIPFPTLPTILSSATDLVNLRLQRIPHTGYISPEAMVASLAALTRLNALSIEFQSSASRPSKSGTRRRAAPPTRVILPALTFFVFRGASEYLEDLVAQIDAPRLDAIKITYFNQLEFHVPQLFRFVGQIQILKQARTKEAQVYFRDSHVYISLNSEQVWNHLTLRISCQGSDWQVSHLAKVLNQASAVLSSVGHLSIGAYELQPNWQDNVEHIDWLEVLSQFTGAETLEVSARLSGHVADALEDVIAVMVPGLLPALRLLCLADEPVERIAEFISARRLSGLPVTIANTPREFLSRREARLWR